MNLFEVLIDTTEQQTIASRIHGAVVGLVTNNQDPDGMGRVKVKFPWLSDQDESHWARITSLMAGKERGLYFLPEVDDEVLVIFEQGDVRFPYVIGALWNGKDKPPAKNDDGKNNVRLIKSRSGHVIRLNDEDGKETIEIIDKTEKNKIVIDTSENTIAITSNKDITLSAPKGAIKLEAQKIQLKSTAETKIEANAGMDIKANATMNVKGATINLN
ncbi:phage tail protein [Phormidesmis priestleyi ULC007]|uniref:Phage tail protein n=1 Tax=Phormidesmis priestleyi ULC007 TaxID=1920490 RepID=A0A2T1DNS0_9CYAN|nr:phage baseplate assembly protein V [Phormidesmis priestleyi]PSB22148.1 phage tail protein [Phormidesmis priestleyi ULC007]PZO52590.1 MAG: phage tail protein [Phormidesmis priestleyi]